MTKTHRWYSAATAVMTFTAVASIGFARADEEASNRPVVVAGQYGNCYAKSVPTGTYGSDGETRVYSVERDADRLVATYAWYANTLRLECNVAGKSGQVGTSVVEFGPWARGHKADSDTLALAFYWNGDLLRRYSTLEIAGRPDNISMSVSHYTVIDGIVGYEWIDGNRYAFVVRTTDGRVLKFDAGTGEKLPRPKPGTP